MLVTGQLLVPEEQHLVVEPRIVQLGHRLVVDVAKLHARDLGTECARERRDPDAVVLLDFLRDDRHGADGTRPTPG